MKRTYVLKLRRRIEGKTNYKKRYKLLLSEKERIVIRRSNRKYSVHISSYSENGDVNSFYVDSFQLEKYGWKGSKSNLPSAYLTGYLFGKMIFKELRDKKEFIPDFGPFKPKKGSGYYAVLKGIIDSGVNINADKSVFPSEDRIRGKHIEDFVKKARGNQFKKVGDFSKRMEENFEKTKKRIDEVFK